MERAKKLLEDEDSYKDPDRTIGNAELLEEAEEDRSHYETEMEIENVDETLELVNHALDEIKSGEGYGVCDKCDGHINPERLKAVPEARYCKKHAEQEEEAIKQQL